MRILVTIGLILLAFAVFPLSAQEQKADNKNATTTQQKIDEQPQIEISAYENRIVVSNVPIGSTLEIYSVVGIKVKEIKMKFSSGEYPVDIAKGYYIIRIGETVRKVAIR